MSQVFDVIVVGARCAGSPLATLLARRGLKVALVEQASFPSDTLSTDIFEAQALGFRSHMNETPHYSIETSDHPTRLIMHELSVPEMSFRQV
jgi:flavin-dependent dehydrogenase